VSKKTNDATESTKRISEHRICFLLINPHCRGDIPLMTFKTLAFTALTATVLTLSACSSGGVTLPDLPPCPGPDCVCADGDNSCTCNAGTECALECGDGCEFDCREDATCASACGNNCSLECVEDTTCTLYTGDNSNVRCTAAQCVIQVGSGSSVQCRDRGMCEVTCLGSCEVGCEGDSTVCQYRCGEGGALMDGPGVCE